MGMHPNVGQPAPKVPNYVRLAVEAGQLIVEDHVLDDDPDSPTEGQFFVQFRGTEPVSY